MQGKGQFVIVLRCNEGEKWQINEENSMENVFLFFTCLKMKDSAWNIYYLHLSARKAYFLGPKQFKINEKNN